MRPFADHDCDGDADSNERTPNFSLDRGASQRAARNGEVEAHLALPLDRSNGVTPNRSSSELRGLKLKEACDGDHRVAVEHWHPANRLDDVPEELIEPGGQVEREHRDVVVLGAGGLLELREFSLDRFAVLGDRCASVGEAAPKCASAVSKEGQVGRTRHPEEAVNRALQAVNSTLQTPRDTPRPLPLPAHSHQLARSVGLSIACSVTSARVRLSPQEPHHW